MIELRDVFCVYSTPEGDAAALQGLTLRIADGEVLAVLGPSGSGKTTLLRVVAGLERPSAGIARVAGFDLPKLPARRLAQFRTRLVGYADQHYSRSLAPELPARAQIELAGALRGLAPAERSRRADELLERVGLADKRDARPAELSGGEQQRVAVCAALAHRPRLFLADEPTGELDHASAELVYRVIGELVREERCTTVIVSHDPESATVTDRVVHIRDGRLAAESSREGGGGEEIVVGRGGWLQVPEEYLLRVGIRSHAVAQLEEGRLVLAAVDGGGGVEPRPHAEPSPAAQPAGVAAEVSGVRKRFGDRTVIDGLDARFAGGRLVAVTGRSGSGKTTLLHLLAGLLEPDGGEILVAGTALGALDREGRAALRARQIGLVPQQPALVSFLSARENVELGLAVRSAPGGAALEVLAAVGLAERATQRVSRLSMGERARVAIARAIAAAPALLLADEPTSRLDEANSLSVAVLLARLARETGAAVVCATHDPVVIEQADDVLALG